MSKPDPSEKTGVRSEPRNSDRSEVSEAPEAEDIRLERISRTLVHDIATPLATMQLNLQALATYLPQLVEHYRRSSGDTSAISPDHLAALLRLPSALNNDVQRLRELTQTFLGDISAGVLAATFRPSETSLGPIQRVLLIEDEDIHQQITLKQLGASYAVDVAGTGAEALKLCGDNAYDLVLLDFLLPGMDGRDLIAALRQRLPETTAIVALSNMPLRSSDYEELGIQGFLPKPFRLQNLEDWLRGYATVEESQM
jgi:CheY-like chemotaxis protein